MPTTNWEVKKQSPHYFHYSLERFFMSKQLRNLRSLLLLLFWESAMGNSNGITTILLVSLKMMDLRNDLCSLRPSNFYPPQGFYPTSSHDVFWTSNEDLFLKRFRFLLPHFHRLMTAMKLDREYFTCDTGKKYPADVCMMVLLRRLSYPCTFWKLATEFGIPSNRLF